MDRRGGVQLRHELVGDDVQHLLQLGHILLGEALLHPAEHRVQIALADVVVVDILLGHRQVVLPLVVGGLLLGDIALLDQTVDLIGCVGGRDVEKAGKLIDGGMAQGIDDLHAEGLHRGEAGLPVLEAGEHRAVEVKLEFRIHAVKGFVQHDMSPVCAPVDRKLRACGST